MMTDKEELFLLEAINSMNQELPKYKKVNVRSVQSPMDIGKSELNDITKTLFSHEELEICNDLTLKEWDDLKYDLEIRDLLMFVKYEY